MNVVYFLIALQVSDLATTLVALRNPKLAESNKLLVRLFNVFGVAPTLLGIKTAFIAWLWWAAPIVEAGGYGAVLWLLCAFYAWVTWNNLRMIRAAA